MSTNNEMRTYLDYVLDHERDCILENCPICQSAQNIYESVRSLIFSDVSYPGVAISARLGAADAVRSAAGVRKVSARQAA